MLALVTVVPTGELAGMITCSAAPVGGVVASGSTLYQAMPKWLPAWFNMNLAVKVHSGANVATDAFFAAFTIPDILNYLVAGGTLSITFIPIYTRHLAAQNEPEGNRVFSIIATTMALVVIAGVIVLEIFTPEIAGRYLHKLKPADLAQAVELTRVLLPAQLFFYLGGLASATLMARHRFVAAAFAPLVYNAGTIIGGAL